MTLSNDEMNSMGEGEPMPDGPSVVQPTKDVNKLPTSWTPGNTFNEASTDICFDRDTWPPHLSDDDLRFLCISTYCERENWTPEALAAIEREKDWKLVDEAPLGKLVDGHCAVCNDTERVRMTIVGVATGFPRRKGFPCLCTAARRVERRWLIDVEEEFRTAKLPDLVPCLDREVTKLSPARQQEIINLLKQGPDRSYYFYGDSGCGKTHFSMALARRQAYFQAVHEAGLLPPSRQPVKVWLIDVHRWTDQSVEWATRDMGPDGNPGLERPLQPVDIHRAVQQGIRPCLFVQELDRYNKTDFKHNLLVDLINACSTALGQIVATSNASPADLAAKWGDMEADVILRRLVKGGVAIEFRK